MDGRIYWLGFSVFPGIGPVKLKKMLSFFGSAKNAWKAPLADLKASGIGPATALQFDDYRKTFSPFAYEEKLYKQDASFLILTDMDYPAQLRASNKPPRVLFTKGKFTFNTPENASAIAVVGTRKVTEYGRQVTELLTAELVAVGCVIISGLAMGVDAIAHRATIASGGRTIAVLGSGVDLCTPKENEALYNSILAHDGVIISETPLGQVPNKGSFPARNRIIAGLSLGVLVTEGAEDSGSLITAKDAFENNRKVFAVPGPITSSVSRGPLALLGQGAKLVMAGKDILEELGMGRDRGDPAERGWRKRVMGDTEEEQRIIAVLSNEQLHFDELVRRTKMTSSQLGSLLSLLEMKRYIKSLDKGIYCISE
ncbi:MAG: DNA-processing protein DprA [Candidatus Levyibacteriota bacterium]